MAMLHQPIAVHIPVARSEPVIRKFCAYLLAVTEDSSDVTQELDVGDVAAADGTGASDARAPVATQDSAGSAGDGDAPDVAQGSAQIDDDDSELPLPQVPELALLDQRDNLADEARALRAILRMEKELTDEEDALLVEERLALVREMDEHLHVVDGALAYLDAMSSLRAEDLTAALRAEVAAGRDASLRQRQVDLVRVLRVAADAGPTVPLPVPGATEDHELLATAVERLRLQSETLELKVNSLRLTVTSSYLKRGGAFCDMQQYREALRDYTRAIRMYHKQPLARTLRSIVRQQADADTAAQAAPPAATTTTTAAAAAVVEESTVREDPYGLDPFGFESGTETSLVNAPGASTVLSGLLSSRALVFSKTRNYGKAIVDYTDVINLDPTYALAYIWRGNLYSKDKQYGSSILDFTAAINLTLEVSRDHGMTAENRADLVDAYNGRGVSYVFQHEYAMALKDYSAALALNPNYVTGYINRGDAYMNLGESEKALADLKRSIELESNNASPFFSCGVVYFNLGDYEQALKHYERAIELDPIWDSKKLQARLVFMRKKIVRERSLRPPPTPDAPTLRRTEELQAALIAEEEEEQRRKKKGKNKRKKKGSSEEATPTGPAEPDADEPAVEAVEEATTTAKTPVAVKLPSSSALVRASAAAPVEEEDETEWQTAKPKSKSKQAKEKERATAKPEPATPPRHVYMTPPTRPANAPVPRREQPDVPIAVRGPRLQKPQGSPASPAAGSVSSAPATPATLPTASAAAVAATTTTATTTTTTTTTTKAWKTPPLPLSTIGTPPARPRTMAEALTGSPPKPMPVQLPETDRPIIAPVTVNILPRASPARAESVDAADWPLASAAATISPRRDAGASPRHVDDSSRVGGGHTLGDVITAARHSGGRNRPHRPHVERTDMVGVPGTVDEKGRYDDRGVWVPHFATRMIDVEKLRQTTEANAMERLSRSEQALVAAFRWLPVRDLCAVTMVCKSWNRASRFPALWRELDVAALGVPRYRVTDAWLAKLAVSYFVGNVSKLFLAGCVRTTNSGLRTLAEALLTGPSLITCDLSFTGCADDTASLLAQRSPGVATLVLRGCKGVGNALLTSLSTSCPVLRTLDVRYCESVSEAGVVALASGARSLTSLDLSNCVHVTDVALHVIGASLSGLTTLALRNCVNITAAGLHSLAAYGRLRVVDVRGCDQVGHNLPAGGADEVWSSIDWRVSVRSPRLMGSGGQQVVIQHE